MSKISSYYNFNPILQRNATMNLIAGGRGIGKTYGAKKYGIQRAISNGEQFIYLRRFKTELKNTATFFSDIAQEFPNYEFKVRGKWGQMRPAGKFGDEKQGWTNIVFFTSLSNALTLKSVNFMQVHTIIFDEFIIPPGALHYLPSEFDCFLDFYSTVDRNSDRVRCFLLANNVSIANPYFIELGIDATREWTKRNGGYVVCHIPTMDRFEAEAYATNFGKFVKGTQYGQYAIESKFSDNTSSMVEPKPAGCDLYCTLETRRGIIGVWMNNADTWQIWITSEPKHRGDVRMTMMHEHVTETVSLSERNSWLLRLVRREFNTGRIRFATIAARTVFADILRR